MESRPTPIPLDLRSPRNYNVMQHELDFQTESPISFADVPSILPRRNGKKVHPSTVYRWATKGARGRVLESMLIGGIRFTTVTALNRFFGATTIKAKHSETDNAIERVLLGSERSVVPSQRPSQHS